MALKLEVLMMTVFYLREVLSQIHCHRNPLVGARWDKAVGCSALPSLIKYVVDYIYTTHVSPIDMPKDG